MFVGLKVSMLQTPRPFPALNEKDYSEIGVCDDFSRGEVSSQLDGLVKSDCVRGVL